MSKFWVIFKREYAQVVKKKSFIFGILLTPALMAVFTILPSWLATQKATESIKLAVIDLSQSGAGQKFSSSLAEYELEKDGKKTGVPYYLITNVFTLPGSSDSRYQVVYDSLAELVTSKELSYFLVIKPGYIENPKDSLFLVTNATEFITQSRFENKMSNIISTDRLQASSINLPVDSVLKLTRGIDLTTRDTRGESVPFFVKYIAAIVFVMLIYIMILTYGQTVMRSVIEEKTSRIMEVLVSSVSPFQLMLGKILGLGAAAFTTVAIWILLGGVAFAVSGAMALKLDPGTVKVLLNPMVVIFFALFLTVGYILYSTLFALVGSIVNSDKEAQNFIFPIVMCLILPMILGMSVIQDPNSTLARTLSLIPFFAPTMMMMRIVFVAPTVTSYSFFSGILAESTLSFLLVTLTTVGMVWLSARIFRVGILMYGKRPTLPELVKWIKY